MRTRSAAQRAAAAAPWAQLPLALWEQIATRLPTADVMSLRQAWRGAAQLAGARVRSEASSRLKKELASCVVLSRGAAVGSAIDGVACMRQEVGGVCLDFLEGWMCGATGGVFASDNYRALECRSFLGQRPGLRSSYSIEPWRTGIRMQAVLTLTAPADFPEDDAVIDLEELRFLTLDGSLLLEYGLAFSMDYRRSVRAIRQGDGTGFGRLQSSPMAEAAAHFQGLRAAAAEQQLRLADGRWCDSLLLPAIHSAVTELYPLQR